MSKWEHINIQPDSSFFPIFQKVLKQIKDGQKEITIKTQDRERSNKIKENIEDTYKFVIEYQDDDINISSIDVYKLFQGASA